MLKLTWVIEGGKCDCRFGSSRWKLARAGVLQIPTTTIPWISSPSPTSQSIIDTASSRRPYMPRLIHTASLKVKHMMPQRTSLLAVSVPFWILFDLCIFPCVAGFTITLTRIISHFVRKSITMGCHKWLEQKTSSWSHFHSSNQSSFCRQAHLQLPRNPSHILASICSVKGRIDEKKRPSGHVPGISKTTNTVTP